MARKKKAPRPKLNGYALACVTKGRKIAAQEKRTAELEAAARDKIAAKHRAAIEDARGERPPSRLTFACRKCGRTIELPRKELAAFLYVKEREKTVEECLLEDEEKRNCFGCPWCSFEGPEHYSMELVTAKVIPT